MSDESREDRQSSRIGTIAAVFAAALVISILAYSQYPGPDAATRGRWTAEAQCGGCHDVAVTAQPVRRSGTPTFVLLASTSPTHEAVHAFLGRSHTVMPPFRLSEEERVNVAAYIVSLAPARR